MAMAMCTRGAIVATGPNTAHLFVKHGAEVLTLGALLLTLPTVQRPVRLQSRHQNYNVQCCPAFRCGHRMYGHIVATVLSG